MAQRAAAAETVESSTLVQVSLPPDMMADIDALADKARVKRATMVRTLLAERLDDLKAQAA
jgi:hypothetical protein